MESAELRIVGPSEPGGAQRVSMRRERPAGLPKGAHDPTRYFTRKPPASAVERARRDAWGREWGAHLSQIARTLRVKGR